MTTSLVKTNNKMAESKKRYATCFVHLTLLQTLPLVLLKELPLAMVKPYL